MGTLHDIESKKACDIILQKWKSQEIGWSNKLIDKDIRYSKTSKKFPSPDRNFYSDKLKTRIAIEFKPYKRETRRGLLTGVGQALAYLHNDNHSASYLLIPETIKTSDNNNDDFPIGDFLEKVFHTKIKGNLPIGLITFKTNDVTKVRMRCNIDENIVLRKITSPGVGANYWTFWRDTYPYAVYLLLKIATEETSMNNRSKKIWDRYFDNYYCPSYVSNTIELVDSKILTWDGSYMQTLSTTKEQLQNYLNGNVDLSKDTHQKFKNFLDLKNITKPNKTDAISYLQERVKKNLPDNLYQDYKKNHFIEMGHLELWDNDTKEVSSLGKKFIEIIDSGGNIVEEVAKIYLGWGRHFELINEIISIQSELTTIPSQFIDFRLILKNSLDKRGYIKHNPNRTKSGVRKFLQSELQLWNHFKIIKMHAGSYFRPYKGFDFDTIKMQKIQKSFEKTYGKAEQESLSDSF